MKNIAKLLGVFLSILMVSCIGPSGRDGFDGIDGIDGIDGDLFEAEAFEINVDMTLNTNTNTYEYLASEYSNGVTVLNSDVVLIYRLEEQTVDGTDVWRQLPQPVVTDNGTAFFNFDFTSINYSIYLEPEFDATLAGLDLTEDQWFRIVIVPATLLNSGAIDNTNLSTLLNSMGIKEVDVQSFNLQY